MGYLKIPNLYKDQQVLEFKRVYAMEKIHGTSAHIRWNPNETRGGKPSLTFFSGGEKYENFVKLFDEEQLSEAFMNFIGYEEAVVYGEAYGGKQQGMSATYGQEPRFVVFDVKIHNLWLTVPKAHALAEKLGFEFVHYVLIDSTLENIDRERDADSVQAVRNGMGEGKKREGIVIRPPFEVTTNNGSRVIAKHKRDDFRETKTPRVVGEKPAVLTKAQEIAEEWVTPMRLEHILQKLPEAKGMEDTPKVMKAMLNDILVEGEGEIVDSKAVRKAISTAAVKLWKARVMKIE